MILLSALLFGIPVIKSVDSTIVSMNDNGGCHSKCWLTAAAVGTISAGAIGAYIATRHASPPSINKSGLPDATLALRNSLFKPY